MSEFDGGVPDSDEPVHDNHRAEETQATRSAGTLLRQAREASGLHIAALAVALKVPVKKLEALEADRLDLLPDAVFVRALASSVCRTLKIDAAEVLALLPQTGKPRLDYQHTSINTPFRSPSDGPGPSLWAQVSRPTVLAGLLLVLGALVLIFMPAVQQQNMADQTPAAGQQAVPAAAQADPVVAAAPAQEPSPTAASETAPGPVVTAPAEPALPASPGVTAATVAAAPAASAPAAVPAAAGGIIIFTAKGESWVEVTDAKGVVVLRRTLVAGEAAGASGVLPLAAVVGRVDATQVEVRGRPFDLAAVSKDNVARFEVK